MKYYNTPFRVGTFRYNPDSDKVVQDIYSVQEIDDHGYHLMYSRGLALYELDTTGSAPSPFPWYDGAYVNNRVTRKHIQEFCREENYNFGKITGYLDDNDHDTPKGVLSRKWMRQIEDNKDIIIIGYGQSGSGKTSSLIHLYNQDKGADKTGLIPRLLDTLDSNKYIQLKIDFVDIYLNWGFGTKSYKEIEDDDYLLRNLFDQTIIFTRIGEKDGWATKQVCIKHEVTTGVEITSLSKAILNAFELREIEPTENNPQSSRSHVLVRIELIKADKSDASKIVLCDLAGVENEFTCSLDRLVLLDKVYRDDIGSKYNQRNVKNSRDIYFDLYGLDDNVKQNQNFISRIKNYSKMEQKITAIRHNIISQLDMFQHFLNDTQTSLSIQKQNIISNFSNYKFEFKTDYIQSYVEDDINQNKLYDATVDYKFKQIIKKYRFSDNIRILYNISQNLGYGCIDQKETEDHFMTIAQHIKYTEEFYNSLTHNVTLNGDWLTDEEFNEKYEQETFYNIILKENAKLVSTLYSPDDDVLRFQNITLFHFIYYILDDSIRLESATYDDRCLIKKGLYAGQRNEFIINKDVDNLHDLFNTDPSVDLRWIYTDNYFQLPKKYVSLNSREGDVYRTEFLNAIQNKGFQLLSHYNYYEDISLSIMENRKLPMHAFMFTNVSEIVDFVYNIFGKDDDDNDFLTYEQIEYIKIFIIEYIEQTAVITDPQYIPNYDSTHTITDDQFQMLKEACKWYRKIYCTLLSYGIIISQASFVNQSKRSSLQRTLHFVRDNVFGKKEDVGTNFKIFTKAKENADLTLRGDKLNYSMTYTFYTKYPFLSKLLHPSYNIDTTKAEAPVKSKMMKFLKNRIDISEVLNETKKVKDILFKDFLLYEMYMFNCRLRRKEGYFINQSLIQLKYSITKYLVRKMTNVFSTEQVHDAAPQMLMYSGSLDGNCWNNSFNYQPFSFFNYPTRVTDETLRTNPSEIIIKLLFSTDIVNTVHGMGLSPNNTRIMVFTVINVNDNDNIANPSADDLSEKPHCNVKSKLVNNPPNPPYINTNELKKFVNRSKYIEQLEAYLKKFEGVEEAKYINIKNTFKTLKDEYILETKHNSLEQTEIVMNYEYYRTDDAFKKLFTFETGLMDPENPNNTISIINYIETNNETTLIGTLNFMNFTTVLQPTGLYPICDGNPQYIDIEN